MIEGLKGSGVIDQAFQIATSDLRGNYSGMGPYAGLKKHREIWGRDGVLAIYAATLLGDFDQTEKFFNTFFEHQREDGLFPTRVEQRLHWLYVSTRINFRIPPTPRYKSSTPWAGDVADVNPWMLIALSFIPQQKNETVVNKTLNKILSGINEQGLFEEGLVAGWADMTFRKGVVSYTNMLVYRALATTGRGEQAEQLKHNINESLWDEELGYFVNFRDGKSIDRTFYSDANLLAIVFGVATTEQSNRILNFIDTYNLNRIPVSTYYKKHLAPKRFFDLEDLYMKTLFPFYHPENIFAWWGPLLVMARLETGDRNGAERDMKSLAKIIVDNGHVHEVMNLNGKPINKWYYKSEVGPSWGAGAFILARLALQGFDIFPK